MNNPNYIGGTDSLDSKKVHSKKRPCKGGAEGVFLFIDLKKVLLVSSRSLMEMKGLFTFNL